MAIGFVVPAPYVKGGELAKADDASRAGVHTGLATHGIVRLRLLTWPYPGRSIIGLPNQNLSKCQEGEAPCIDDYSFRRPCWVCH